MVSKNTSSMIRSTSESDIYQPVLSKYSKLTPSAVKLIMSVANAEARK